MHLNCLGVCLEEQMPPIVILSHHLGCKWSLLETGKGSPYNIIHAVKMDTPCCDLSASWSWFWVVSPVPSIRFHPPLPYIHALLVQFPFLRPKLLTAAFITGISVAHSGSGVSLKKRIEVQRLLLLWRTGEHPLVACLLFSFFPPQNLSCPKWRYGTRQRHRRGFRELLSSIASGLTRLSFA